MVLRNGGVSARAIGGRTTYSMAAATPASRRIPISQLRPGDQIMFGDARGPRSPNNVIGHTAISLGGDWFVQSSSQGVTIEQLTGSYRTDFAFARRFSVVGYHRPAWRPPPPTPPPAQLSSALELVQSPGAAPVIAVAWTGPADPSLQTQLVAVPADDSAPTTLATRQPTSGSASVAVPAALVGQAFQLDLVTLRDGQELGRSSAPIAPPTPPAAP